MLLVNKSDTTKLEQVSLGNSNKTENLHDILPLQVEYYKMDDVLNEVNVEKTSGEILEQILSEIKFLRNQMIDIRGSFENEMGKFERRLLSIMDETKSNY
ncbi:hypothetical protein [Bacillus marasmi]|uniref:hypothetical protein n=1 Tax=Bacillus marasmi TaxID=1926279 RepID=UPI0011C7A31B|nr:hypothetical protein [Bacillus marasmi]